MELEASHILTEKSLKLGKLYWLAVANIPGRRLGRRSLEGEGQCGDFTSHLDALYKESVKSHGGILENDTETDLEKFGWGQVLAFVW